jgi:hypothetical protein
VGERIMKYQKTIWSLILFFFLLSPIGFAEENDLQHFLKKTSSKTNELSKKERSELLDRIGKLMEKTKEVHLKLTQAIQTGDLDIRYQEGKFWESRMEEDWKSIEVAFKQLKLLEERSTHLLATLHLYKSLKDLSSNYNVYNNTPSFSAFVGDLAPELELWGDPVFFELYLLPLARLKDVEKKTIQKEKAPVPKGKKP